MAVPPRRALRVVAGVEFEADRLERAPAVDVDDDVAPLAPLQEDAVPPSGPRHAAPAAPARVKRDTLGSLTEGEKQAARVGGPQVRQPQPPGGGRPPGVEPAVH